MKRTDRRSDCPVNFALQVFGDSWSLLILRDILFKGKHTYAEFAASEERISTNVLAARLKTLVAEGLVYREGRGRATKYYATPKGQDLLPIMLDMIVWAARHDPASAAPPDFVRRAVEEREQLLAELRAGVGADLPLPPPTQEVERPQRPF